MKEAVRRQGHGDEGKVREGKGRDSKGKTFRRGNQHRRIERERGGGKEGG